MFSGIHNAQVSEPLNFTVTPLVANATFTGSISSTAGWETISINIISDQSSATNGLVVQFFLDAAGTVSLGSFSVTYSTPNTLSFFQSAVHGAYYKLSYTNGSVNQTQFTLLPFLSLAGKTGTVIPNQNKITAGLASQIVKTPSETVPGTSLPTTATLSGGSDGSNIQSLSVDSTGKLKVANFPVPVDTNYGTVGTSTIRTASELGNATGSIDYNEGANSAQTLRTSANIARNGNELSYNAGTSDANTLRTASNIKREGNDLDYNFGTVGANTLRVAAETGNATGAADFNFGTVGAQTLRTAAEVGNSTGAADFNNGASGAQTLRTAANIADGAGTKLSSQLIGSAQSLNVASQGTVASATTDSGNPVKMGAVFNTTLPTVTNGQRVDSQADLNGRLIVSNAPLDGYKATYSATSMFTAAAAATDIFTLTGSATKTVRVARIGIAGTQTAQSVVGVTLLKRSTANSGGTSTTLTATPFDSTDAAATATARSYTVNPTTGTLIGNIQIRQVSMDLTTKSTGADPQHDVKFGSYFPKAIVLRGTSEVFAINLAGQTVTGNVLSIYVEWTEA